MNLNKGIFRIWLIIVPIVWIVSFIYVAQDINYPNYSCETEREKNCQCVYTLGDKKYTERCGFGPYLQLGPCSNKTNMQALGFKNLESCESFTRNAKKTKTCTLDKEKVKSCESEKDIKRTNYIISIIILIIFPLTFYPIYLGLRRLFMWVWAGFKK